MGTADYQQSHNLNAAKPVNPAVGHQSSNAAAPAGVNEIPQYGLLPILL
ncbi:MAG: hypothetical protein IPO42_16215 [Chitinophagaceae bacterium]|nr:hypothetical protein [Chitinophagaceae bacterium]